MSDTPHQDLPEIELSGMWERADFEGGLDEVRVPLRWGERGPVVGIAIVRSDGTATCTVTEPLARDMLAAGTLKSLAIEPLPWP